MEVRGRQQRGEEEVAHKEGHAARCPLVSGKLIEFSPINHFSPQMLAWHNHHNESFEGV